MSFLHNLSQTILTDQHIFFCTLCPHLCSVTHPQTSPGQARLTSEFFENRLSKFFLTYWYEYSINSIKSSIEVSHRMYRPYKNKEHTKTKETTQDKLKVCWSTNQHYWIVFFRKTDYWMRSVTVTDMCKGSWVTTLMLTRRGLEWWNWLYVNMFRQRFVGSAMVLDPESLGDFWPSGDECSLSTGYSAWWFGTESSNFATTFLPHFCNFTAIDLKSLHMHSTYRSIWRPTGLTSIGRVVQCIDI